MGKNKGKAMRKSAARTTHDNSVQIDKILNGAVELQSNGFATEAEDIYRKILKKFPNHPGTLRLMAVLTHQNGQNNGEAIKLLKEALKADPSFALAHKNLGYLFALEGRNAEAILHFGETVKRDPKDIECRLEMARLHDIEKQPAEALALYHEIILIAPNDARAYRGICNIQSSVPEFEATNGEWDEAADAMRTALRLAPDDYTTQVHGAVKFAELKQIDDARAAFQRASELDPTATDPVFLLGNLEREQKNPQLAIDLYSRTIELKPDHAFAYSNLCVTLAENAVFEDAIACGQMAIQLQPKLQEAYLNLASAYQNMGRAQEALDVYQQAAALENKHDPKLLWNIALCLLSVGRIEEGWDIYGFGFESGQRKPFRPFPGLIWRGEDLSDKTIMITREQGIGDDIRFSTCFHEIVVEAKHVIIETDERLVPLYQRTWPNALVRKELNRSTGLQNLPAEEIDFDITAPAGMIASQRRRSLEAFPDNPRHLVADPAKRQGARAWLDSLGDGPKIGLTWRSGIRESLRDIMTVPPAEWREFLGNRQAKLISLQHGQPAEEIAAAEAEFGVIIHQMPDLDTHNDLDGTAALTAELDCVTGLWNAATEMAGALGVPGVIYMHANHQTQLGSGRLPWHPSLDIISVVPGFDHTQLLSDLASGIERRLGY
jgi:tetratricopeptide (TPR) repeat protein